jgi:hypothetical protein
MVSTIEPPFNTRRILSSFRDPSGHLFLDQGRLFRQINRIYQDDYDLLMASGLYDRLTKKGWLIPHREVESPSNCAEFYKIIEPNELRFISYPYEWCFSQLKHAALLTLSIQKEALERGLCLKDASAYNIQFEKGNPVLIDTLSFSKHIEGQPWLAYRQFCMHFLAPLALMSYRDIRLGRLSMQYIDGVPLDLGSQLLPAIAKLNPGIYAHLILHARAQMRHSQPCRILSQKVSKGGMIGLMNSLENTVNKLTWKPHSSEWIDYYRNTNYTEASFNNKKQIIREIIKRLKPHVVWDLGANTGIFSRIVQEDPKLRDCLVISSDMDPGAVEVNYLECKKQRAEQIYPLVMDLANPSPGIGWGNFERQSFYQRGPADLIIALALIHHLAISNNVPFDDIARLFAKSSKHVIIEFISKEDSQVKQMLASREDIFSNYTLEGFCGAFTRYFQLEQQIPIAGTHRTIFLLSNKDENLKSK